MAENKYCSTKFKRGEDLDAALDAALRAGNNALRAETARKAIEDMEVAFVTLAEGEAPTVEKTEENGVVKLTFGLVPGAKGDPGEVPEEWGERLTGLEAHIEEQEIVLEQKEVLLAQQMTALSKQVAALEGASGLPAVTEDDNEKILQVVDGTWAVVALVDSAVKTYVDDYMSAIEKAEDMSF